MGSRICFIVNPAAGAGRAKERWESFQRRVLAQDGSAEVVITKRIGEATAIACEAAQTCERIIAVGGDGTAAEVAEGILLGKNKACVLGGIPLGTGNDIAQSLGIATLEDARRALTTNVSRLMDVIEVHCFASNQVVQRHALLFAGVGLVSAVLRQTTPFLKRVFGQAGAYRAGLLRALWSYRPPQMRIRCDGRESERPQLFLGISN